VGQVALMVVRGEVECSSAAPVFDCAVARELGVSLVGALLRLVLNADCVITNQRSVPSPGVS
jgi:hypothetical protein